MLNVFFRITSAVYTQEIASFVEISFFFFFLIPFPIPIMKLPGMWYGPINRWGRTRKEEIPALLYVSLPFRGGK